VVISRIGKSKYKGAFIRTFTIEDALKSLKKVLGGARWIDKFVKCEDEATPSPP
jgi:hypothetical protein